MSETTKGKKEDKIKAKQKKQPQQGKNQPKIRAWCGECFQFFENGPHAKICIDHINKGFCNLIECKKNSEIKCIRKFPNTNSENRHTYCIDEASIREYDNNIKLQCILGNKRKVTDNIDNLITSLKPCTNDDVVYCQDDKDDDQQHSANESKLSKLNNCNLASLLERSNDFKSSLQILRNNQKNDVNELFATSSLTPFSKGIPNIIDSLEADKISVQTMIFHPDIELKLNNKNSTDLTHQIDTECQHLIDNLKINKSIMVVSDNNKSLNNKLMKKKESSNIKTLKNTSELFNYLDKNVSRIKKENKFENEDLFSNSNIFGLCEKINNFDFFDKNEQILINSKYFEEEEVLDKLLNMKFSTDKKNIKKSIGIQTELKNENNISEFDISSLKKSLYTKDNSILITNAFNDDNEDPYAIKKSESTESIFNNFNKNNNCNFSKVILNKFKSIFKKKGLINANTIRLYMDKKELWSQLIDELKKTSTQIEGIAVILESSLNMKLN